MKRDMDLIRELLLNLDVHHAALRPAQRRHHSGRGRGDPRLDAEGPSIADAAILTSIVIVLLSVFNEAKVIVP